MRKEEKKNERKTHSMELRKRTKLQELTVTKKSKKNKNVISKIEDETASISGSDEEEYIDNHSKEHPDSFIPKTRKELKILASKNEKMTDALKLIIWVPKGTFKSEREKLNIFNADDPDHITILPNCHVLEENDQNLMEILPNAYVLEDVGSEILKENEEQMRKREEEKNVNRNIMNTLEFQKCVKRGDIKLLEEQNGKSSKSVFVNKLQLLEFEHAKLFAFINNAKHEPYLGKLFGFSNPMFGQRKFDSTQLVDSTKIDTIRKNNIMNMIKIQNIKRDTTDDTINCETSSNNNNDQTESENNN